MSVYFTGLMEFHISRQARDLYQFDEILFSQSGNVIFANFHSARVFAQKMNQKRDLVNFPEQAVRSGQINAMGLIDEILHMVAYQYRQQLAPNALRDALDWLDSRLGKEAVDAALRAFSTEFPPVAVYRQVIGLEDYLAGSTERMPNRQIVLEEMLMLWLANTNPAFAPYLELFDDERLEKQTVYPHIITQLRDFFDTQPRFGPDNQNLIDMLRAPALASPHSLTGQLEFIRTRWSALLGRFLYRLFSSLDLIKEEEKAIFLGGGGPGPSRVYEFTGMEFEPERYSMDRDWMPRLVLIAKNSYVWLDQLSKKYQRAITTLDLIPDQELDQLSRWGFTGLWLIGLWERSQASRTIKQLRGNPEAVASAYSLFSYEIAGDLGGDAAYQDLARRAWQRGIRLSADMVPNHMGIDSRWVIEHPDWFISQDYSPFPSYTFNGPNLSWDQRVGLYIEDHYYNNTDAAVVFKRVDNYTGSTRYIYHGNDGTSYPWNDTAQLNYLIAEVREAVIQTILSVARKFPVIRFDAAMTLAKKHYQRLWFPEPGTGGAIPSRAEHAMTKEQFDAAMPEEFWREVVDRVAQEVPDTLLLAEAFWLMEGYFVRTLGMHRVYNSAFMNMLRDEKNAEYRLVIKNTIEFDPEILKRYVNFMNNPDERTAVDQFGKGDKYFGVATLLATMPGLPMFGHGQIEGFTERYGMEYRRAYWDEHPDPYLVERHEREIFPLLRRRYLFAEVKDFLLYDFYTPEGFVNEDVFAYSNRAGDERSLVIYHNKYASARGWIRTSAAYLEKSSLGPERALMQKNLGEGLGLRHEPDTYIIFRDQINGLEYIRNNRDLFDNGLYIELEAYKYHVFLDFKEVQDNEWRQYEQLAAYLNGNGVPSIDEALREIFLQPIHYPYRELINPGMLQWIIDNRLQIKSSEPANLQLANLQPVLEEVEGKEDHLLSEINHIVHGNGEQPGVIAHDIREKLEQVLRLPLLERELPEEADSEAQDTMRDAVRDAIEYILAGPGGKTPYAEGDPQVWSTLLCWLFTYQLGKVVSDRDETFSEMSRSWIDEWLLGRIITSALQGLGLDEVSAAQSLAIVKVITGHRELCREQAGMAENAYQYLQDWLADSEVQRSVGVNRYQGILWFNQEAFENFLWWMFASTAIEIIPEGRFEVEAQKGVAGCYQVIQQIRQAEQESGYQVEKLLDAVKTIHR